MQSLINGSNRSRNAGWRRLLLAALCALVAIAALVSAGCDPDDYNLGQDARLRSDGSRASTGPKYYPNHLGHPIRADSPDFLAPTETTLDKAPRVADPDALVLSDDPLLTKAPPDRVNLDTEDHVAGNFKYYKEGYREPLLPTATADKESQSIGADGLDMNDRKAIVRPGDSDITGPSGALGRLQSEHDWRQKHAKDRDPSASYDYLKGKFDEDNEASDNIIRSDDAPPPPPPPPSPHRL